MKSTRKINVKNNILGIAFLLVISETAVSSGDINAPLKYKEFSDTWATCVERNCEPMEGGTTKIADLNNTKNLNDSLVTAARSAYDSGLVVLAEQRTLIEAQSQLVRGLLVEEIKNQRDPLNLPAYLFQSALLTAQESQESQIALASSGNFLTLQNFQEKSNISNLELARFKAGTIDNLWDIASRDDYTPVLVAAAVNASQSRLNHAQQAVDRLEFNRSDAAKSLEAALERLPDLEEDAESSDSAYVAAKQRFIEADNKYIAAIVASKVLIGSGTGSPEDFIAAGELIKETGEGLESFKRDVQESETKKLNAAIALDSATTVIDVSQQILDDLLEPRATADTALNEIHEFENSGSPSVDLLDAMLRQDDTGGAIFEAVEDTYQLTAVNKAKITTNESAISTNEGSISTNDKGISTNKASIATNESAISTSAESISTNANGISTNKESISTNANGISTNKESTVANQSAISMNANGISTNKESITTNLSAISTNANGISTNKESIATNLSTISTNAESISTNAKGVSANATAITSATGLINSNSLDIQRVEIQMAENVDLLKSGIASSLAIAGMPAAPRDGMGFSIGTGYFDGESAVAMGLTYVDSNRTFKLSVGHAGGETSASAGAAFNF